MFVFDKPEPKPVDLFGVYHRNEASFQASRLAIRSGVQGH